MLSLQSSKTRLTLFVALSAAGLTAFWPSVYSVVYSVLHRQGSSHGIFIPLLSAYFIYIKRSQLKRLSIRYFPPAMFAAGLLLMTAAVSGGHHEVGFMAFVLYVAAMVWFCFGREVFSALLFPIAFTATMIPIPGELYAEMADITRHITFTLSLKVLSLFDIPFYREGWLIKLPNALLEVAESCSGIRYLISYFVFGIAYAYLFRETLIHRTLLIAATIPISLAASTLRLTIIFLATHFISPAMAEYWPHVILSWFVFFTILFGLIFLDQRRLNVADSPEAGGAVRS
jgi:exosortase